MLWLIMCNSNYSGVVVLSPATSSAESFWDRQIDVNTEEEEKYQKNIIGIFWMTYNTVGHKQTKLFTKVHKEVEADKHKISY